MFGLLSTYIQVNKNMRYFMADFVSLQVRNTVSDNYITHYIELLIL
jgi:ribosomal protein S17E